MKSAEWIPYHTGTTWYISYRSVKRYRKTIDSYRPNYWWISAISAGKSNPGSKKNKKIKKEEEKKPKSSHFCHTTHHNVVVVVSERYHVVEQLFPNCRCFFFFAFFLFSFFFHLLRSSWLCTLLFYISLFFPLYWIVNIGVNKWKWILKSFGYFSNSSFSINSFPPTTWPGALKFLFCTCTFFFFH